MIEQIVVDGLLMVGAIGGFTTFGLFFFDVG